MPEPVLSTHELVSKVELRALRRIRDQCYEQLAQYLNMSGEEPPEVREGVFHLVEEVRTELSTWRGLYRNLLHEFLKPLCRTLGVSYEKGVNPYYGEDVFQCSNMREILKVVDGLKASSTKSEAEDQKEEKAVHSICSLVLPLWLMTHADGSRSIFFEKPLYFDSPTGRWIPQKTGVGVVDIPSDTMGAVQGLPWQEKEGFRRIEVTDRAAVLSQLKKRLDSLFLG